MLPLVTTLNLFRTVYSIMLESILWHELEVFQRPIISSWVIDYEYYSLMIGKKIFLKEFRAKWASAAFCKLLKPWGLKMQENQEQVTS